MPNPDPQATPPRRPRLLLTLIIATAVIAVIALHLTGVIGPGTH